MKKVVSYVASFALILTLLFVPNMQAYAANVSLGVSASTVNIGDTVTVTVTVPDGYTATVDLVYSSSILSFVSASTEVNANGSNVRVNLGKYAPSGSNSVSVTFKANTSGTASFSASVASAVDNETVEDVALGGASTSITVANQAVEEPAPPPASSEQPGNSETEAPKSADNSLSKLKLSSGILSPSFKYNVTKYTATVGYDVKSVVVSATPSNEKATIESVTGNGNVNLEVGENTIQVVVKAENGVKATYTIVVTRLPQEETTTDPSESESDSSGTESEEPPETTEPLQWNGQKLQPAEDIPTEIVPDDFQSTTVMINSVETPCLTFERGNLKVLYLQNEEGVKGLYVYDEVQHVVYPFVKLESANSYVIVLLPDETNAPAPENYKACTFSIEGKGVINAYQFVQPAASEETETTSWFGSETFYAAEPVATDFYLMYCMNNTGEKGWYVYDSVEGTFQRYLASVHTPATEIGAELEENNGNTEQTKDSDKLQKELAEAKKMQLMILCIAVFVVVILVVIIINLILRRRSEEDFDDEEYDDEEYDDEEYDNKEDAYYDAYEFEEDEDTTEEAADDEIEIEFYEMPQEENAVESIDEVEDDEVEIEFYEMPQEETIVESLDEEEDDEVEIEFYEMTEEVTEDDEVEVEFYNMEDLLMKEAIASEEPSNTEKKEIPVEKQEAPAPVPAEHTYVDEDDDDDDLEFIELD